MSKVDELLTSVQALKDEETVVLKFITDQAAVLAQTSSDLQAAKDALANAGVDTTKIQSAIDSINQKIKQAFESN